MKSAALPRPASAGADFSFGPREQRLALRLLVLSCAVFGLLRWAQLAKSHLPFPMDLYYETPNVIAVSDIRAGESLYLKSRMEGMPFHIFSYTPLFHLLASAFPLNGANPFFWGRLIAGLFMLSSAVFFGPFGKKEAFPLCLCGAAAFIMADFVSQNAFYFKSDAMGLFFSLAAVAAAGGIERRKLRSVAAPAVLCFLSFMAKQNFVAAAAAIAVYLLATDWKKSLAFSLLYGGLMAAGLGFMTWKFGQGFWISTFGFLGNPFSAADLAGFLLEALRDPAFTLVLLTALFLFALSRRSWRESPRALYAAAALFIAGTGLGTTGASLNYLIEPFAALIMFAAHRLARPESSRLKIPILAALFAVSGYKMKFAEPLQYSQLSRAVREELRTKKHVIEDEVASFGVADPRILNLVEAPVGLVLSPRNFLSDVFHYSLLWKRGVISMDPLYAALDAKAFDLVVLPATVTPDHPARLPHLEPLRVKIFETYAVEKKGVYFNFLRPRENVRPAAPKAPAR